MAFVKVVKTNAYFKRYQTAFRRRREGKTDYYARKRLIIQDKDKYNSPKYRLVVRKTSSKIIAQIIYATIKGDKVLCSAESTELKRFGVKAGLTNYAASYATGLLVARRLLRQLKMDELYKGAEKVNGEIYDVNENQNETRRPFKAILDTGLVRTTTGNRVFGALKGAADGGLYVPHSEKRFPGYVKSEEEDVKDKYDAKVHRERIFGVHVDHYIQHLKAEGNQETYKRQFSKWDATLKEAKIDTVEKLFTKAHAEIRKNPERLKKEAKKNPSRKHAAKRQKRINAAARKANVQKKFNIALNKK